MAIVNGYATLAEMRLFLGYTDATNTAHDALLEDAVEAASRLIDGHTGRRFWVDGTVQDRVYYADDGRCCPVDDVSTVTGLVVKLDQDGDGTFETTLTITTDFLLEPLNAADRIPVWPYDEIVLTDNYSFPRFAYRPGVQVTAKFGWPAVPDDVSYACRILAKQEFESRNAIAGAFALGESISRNIPGLDFNVRALLADYRKPVVG